MNFLYLQSFCLPQLLVPSSDNSYMTKCYHTSKKSINKAHLENGTYEQIVTHLEKEFELNGLESPEELQLKVVSHYATDTIAEGPKPTCHHFKTPGYYGKWCPLLNKKEQVEGTQTNPGGKNSGAKNSIPNNNNNNNKNNKNSNRAEKSQKLFIDAVRHVAKRTTPQRDIMFEPMQRKGHFSRTANRNDRVEIINRTHRIV